MFLSEINIYPIKSLKGIAVTEAKVLRRGLEFDRRWMLIDENNKFLTQREFPKMATINVQIAEDGLHISTSEETLLVPFEIDKKQTETVQIWKSKCPAKIYEKPVNEWFGDILQTKCKLALMPEETHKISPGY